MELDCRPQPTNIRDAVSKVWKISSEIISNKRLNGSLRIDTDVPKMIAIDPFRFN